MERSDLVFMGMTWKGAESEGKKMTTTGFSPGLTKKEFFATVCLHGLLAGRNPLNSNFPLLVSESIKYADELLKVLNDN